MRVIIVGAAGAMASVAMRDLLSSVDDVFISAVDARPVLLSDPRLRMVTLDVQDEQDTTRALEQHDVVLKWKVAAGAFDTGVPISIVAQMLARGEIRSPGVWCPETCVPPQPFFHQLERRGIRVSSS